MIRNLVSRINGMIIERAHAARRKYHAPIKIWFAPQLNTGNLKSSAEGIHLSGETFDLSGSGIGFVVSSIRIKENYLVGQERLLKVEIDLPGGKVRMKVIGRRYERIGVHLSMEKYLVGAEIVEMSKNDREAYDHFLRFGTKQIRAAAAAAAGMELEVE